MSHPLREGKVKASLIVPEAKGDRNDIQKRNDGGGQVTVLVNP